MDKLSQSDQRLLTSPNQLSSHWCHSPKQRTVQLQAIAQLLKNPDRTRPSASDLIQQQQGEKALKAMDS